MSDYTEQAREHLAKQVEANQRRSLAEATARQRQIAADGRERKAVAGLGKAVMEVDKRVYNEWVRKEGKEIWRDPKFRKWIGEKNPELRCR